MRGERYLYVDFKEKRMDEKGFALVYLVTSLEPPALSTAWQADGQDLVRVCEGRPPPWRCIQDRV